MDDVITGDTADRKRGGRALHTTRRFYRIDKRDISYLRFILEGYDGIAVLTTQDAVRGIVSITIAPGCEALVDDAIAALSEAEEIFIEPLSEDSLETSTRGWACADSL